jgi:hypothetical protein
MNVVERSSHERGGTGRVFSRAVGEEPRERSLSLRLMALCEGIG